MRTEIENLRKKILDFYTDRERDERVRVLGRRKRSDRREGGREREREISDEGRKRWSINRCEDSETVLLQLSP